MYFLCAYVWFIELAADSEIGYKEKVQSAAVLNPLGFSFLFWLVLLPAATPQFAAELPHKVQNALLHGKKNFLSIVLARTLT